MISRTGGAEEQTRKESRLDKETMKPGIFSSVPGFMASNKKLKTEAGNLLRLVGLLGLEPRTKGL
jgi:hypothetical protein